jgi:hypothetical protein
MEWLEKLNADPLPWLLEADDDNPGVRFFALLELEGRQPQDTQVTSAREHLMQTGPVPRILEAQKPDGYWEKPGPGYNPKYRSTMWSLSLLAQLGASGEDARVRRGCEYLLEHSPSPYGGFSMDARPGGMVHCLQGNLGATLLDLGYLGDARLDDALDWLVRSVTGTGIATAGDKDAPVRYYRSGNSGPGFQCSANNHKACAWGAVKAMLALSKLPQEKCTPAIQEAMHAGLDFLLAKNPALADYPTPFDSKPSQSWFRFGYPLFYVTDVLQNLEVLTALGQGGDARLYPALELLLRKQDARGRWKMEYTYNGKTWVDVEQKGAPSKWVTLRALRVLKRAGEMVL